MPDKKFTDLRAHRLPLYEIRDRVQNSMILAGLTALLAYPMFHYQFHHLMGNVFPHAPTAMQLKLFAMGQTLILFAIALLCSLLGFLYFERLSLPGLGKPADLAKWLLPAVLAGILLTPVAYYIADRRMLVRLPEAFPDTLPWALAVMAGGALSQEVIGRLGLLSVGIYVLRWRGFTGHPWPAILAVSAFAAVCGRLYLARISYPAGEETLQVAVSLAYIFAFHWVLCEVYIRKGFFAAVAVHFGLVVKFAVYAVWL